MKASELIKQMQDLVNEHGDQEVYGYNDMTEDGYRAWAVKYTDNVESEFYYQSDPPGEGSGIFVY